MLSMHLQQLSNHNTKRFPSRYHQLTAMRQPQSLLVSSIVCITMQQTVNALSSASCAQLQWDASTFGSSSVCSGSNLPNTVPICDPAATWSDANALCAGAGARLCTFEELVNQESRGAGCGIDGSLLWSSTACNGGYLLEYGAANFQEVNKTCAVDSPGVVNRFRCCADVFDAVTPVPTATPTTPLPTVTPTTPLPTVAAVVTSSPTLTPTTALPTVAAVATSSPTPDPTTPLPTTTPIAATPSPTVGEINAEGTIPADAESAIEPETEENDSGSDEQGWSYRQQKFRQFCSRNAASISYITIGSVLAVGGAVAAIKGINKAKKSSSDTSDPTTSSEPHEGSDVELAELEHNDA
jgi:hypothetical protein